MLKNLLKKPHLKLKKLKIAFVIAFSNILFPAWGHESPVLVLVPKEQKIISFSLPSNPTTGYRWNIIKYDKNILEYIKTDFQAKKPQLIGSGGFEKFYFKKKNQKAFTTEITLNYSRSWEKNSVRSQIVKISSN